MKSLFAWLVVPLLMTSLVAQTATPRPKTKKSAKPAEPKVTAADVQASQQAAQQAQSAANDAQTKASAAATAATAGADKESVDKLDSDLADVKTTVQNQLLTTQDEQK